ncbi:MAG: PQQ-binding-like beta-propeller repeat protein [Acidimicrobiia bacterium]
MLPDPYRPIIVGAAIAAALATTSVILFWLFAPGGVAATNSPASDTALPTIDTEVTPTTGTTRVSTTVIEPTAPTSTTPDEPLHAWVDSRTVGQPYGSVVEGLLTFRGNPTNTYYGSGPIPTTPEIKWSYPDSPMCASSTDLGVTSTWCGNGWTGQPVIWERPDGITEMIFGAYDRRLHFVDAESGQPTRSPILTGDIIKGTPTIDPDGYPLVYFGSRDNKLRIVALDRTEPVVIWEVEADLQVEGRWNDDWDASPRIVNDIMFEGAENGIFYIFKLNRAFDDLGLVTVEPELKFKMETWTEKLLNDIGPSYPAVSVENSAVLFEGRVYFANSGGRVIGLDITNIENGEAPVVFDYWVGDDVDASIVVDDEGMLYVSVEYERYLDRAKELGQVIKLDPYNEADPYVWGMFSLTEPPAKGGLWSTPALGKEVLYVVTNKGFLVAVDRQTGEEVWVFEVGEESWSSPAIVDGHLLVAGNTGLLRSFFIGADEREPVLQWTFKVGDGHIESTPAVWNGMIYLGNRDGFMYAVGQQNG